MRSPQGNSLVRAMLIVSPRLMWSIYVQPAIIMNAFGYDFDVPWSFYLQTVTLSTYKRRVKVHFNEGETSSNHDFLKN